MKKLVLTLVVCTVALLAPVATAYAASETAAGDGVYEVQPFDRDLIYCC